VAGGAARTVCRMYVFGMIPTQILVEPRKVALIPTKAWDCFNPLHTVSRFLLIPTPILVEPPKAFVWYQHNYSKQPEKPAKLSIFAFLTPIMVNVPPIMCNFAKYFF
jgi:hypothetical protein